MNFVIQTALFPQSRYFVPPAVFLVNDLPDDLVLDWVGAVRLVLEVVVSQPDQIQVGVDHAVGRGQDVPSRDERSPAQEQGLRLARWRDLAVLGVTMGNIVFEISHKSLFLSKTHVVSERSDPRPTVEISGCAPDNLGVEGVAVAALGHLGQADGAPLSDWLRRSGGPDDRSSSAFDEILSLRQSCCFLSFGKNQTFISTRFLLGYLGWFTCCCGLGPLSSLYFLLLGVVRLDRCRFFDILRRLRDWIRR